MNLYDVIEYPSYAIPQSYPDKLAVVGTMFGMSPVSPHNARVLDVGCGAGGNLLPMASLWPGGEYVGIDLASTAIDKANAKAARLGLTNVRFECVDLMDLPVDFGKFDYIIAHGFISWVPIPVRERLFQVCRDRLTPQGIGYISYNAYPGCHVRDMFREIMREHTRGIEDPNEVAMQARAFVESIADSGVAKDALQELARFERDVICRKSIGSLMHDELNETFNSLYFREFEAMAARHSLQFLFEAVYDEGQPPVNLTEEAAALLDSAKQRGLVPYEQYQDFFKLRRFRQSLVTHAEVALVRDAPESAMHKFHFAAPLQRSEVEQGIEFSNAKTKAGAVTPNPITIGAMDRIGRAWPSTIAFNDLADDQHGHTVLVPILERFFAAGLIDVHATARVCPQQLNEKPEVWSYARSQAAEGERVLTPLTLTAVAVEDENIRKLVMLADGTRTIEELAATMGDKAGVERALTGAARMGFLVR